MSLSSRYFVGVVSKIAEQSFQVEYLLNVEVDKLVLHNGLYLRKDFVDSI
jgi:hypothetical protein